MKFNDLTKEEQNFIIALMQENVCHMIEQGASTIQVTECIRDYYLAFQGLEDRMSNG